VPKSFVARILWAMAYLATMFAVAASLVRARQWSQRYLARPEAVTQWRQWQSTADNLDGQPRHPVQRRRPVSDEPPTLVVLRDSFPAVLGVSLLIATVLFGFVMHLAVGAFAGEHGSSRSLLASGRGDPAGDGLDLKDRGDKPPGSQTRRK